MFSSKQFFPDALLARLTETRVNDPDFAWRAARVRTRRERLAPDGKLNILAADHPARNVTKVGAEPLAMADRRDYLARILRVLSSERVDGIMATMDILEDLLAIDGFLRDAGAPTLLDGRVLIAQPESRRPGGQQLGVGRSGDRRDAGDVPGMAAGRSQAPAARGRARTCLAEDAAGVRACDQRVQCAGAADVPGAAAGDQDRKGLRGGEDRRGPGAPRGRGVARSATAAATCG